MCVFYLESQQSSYIKMIRIAVSIYGFGHGKKAWFLNHVNDFYVKKANELNYRSRASFKLLQLLKKHPSIIKEFSKQPKNISPSQQQQKSVKSMGKVLDLGCAPGSWSQVMKELLPNSSVVGVDLLDLKSIQGVDLYKCDARSKDLHTILQQKYGKFELIISDMAPNFDGDKANTHMSILQLNALCVQLCFQLATPGCSLIMKSSQGEKQRNFHNLLSSVFKNVFRQKPSSSRSESMEFFYVCENLIPVTKKQSQKLIKQFQNISLNISIEIAKFSTKKDSIKFIESLLKEQ